jgi:hypothetical protein
MTATLTMTLRRPCSTTTLCSMAVKSSLVASYIRTSKATSL